MTYALSEDSGLSGHPPSLIKVFAVCMRKHWVLSYPLSGQRRLWSDWAGLSLRWKDRPYCWFYHAVAQLRSKQDGYHKVRKLTLIPAGEELLGSVILSFLYMFLWLYLFLADTTRTRIAIYNHKTNNLTWFVNPDTLWQGKKITQYFRLVYFFFFFFFFFCSTERPGLACIKL